MRRSCAARGGLCAIMLMAACVPAQSPAVRDATPGSPVTVTADRVITAAFQVDYPAGWRVITSPAGEPPFVILAAPDNCTVVQVSVSVEPPPPAIDAACASSPITATQSRFIGQTAITISGSAADPAALDSVFALLLETLTPS
ncbi:MAG: hypothetical protein SF162_09370 [bacterium]|nr:hypothetical protein [bacterium]